MTFCHSRLAEYNSTIGETRIFLTGNTTHRQDRVHKTNDMCPSSLPSHPSHRCDLLRIAMAPLILHSNHGLGSLWVPLLRILLSAVFAAAGRVAFPHGLLARMRLYIELVALLVGDRRRLVLWGIVSDLLDDGGEARRGARHGADDA